MSKQRQALEAAKALLEDIVSLIGESSGVYGLHLNGNASPWDEIIKGGGFERLPDLIETAQTIEAALAEPEQEPVMRVTVHGSNWGLDYMSLPVGTHNLYTENFTHTAKPREWQAAEASREPEPKTHCKFGNLRAQCQQSPMDCQCCQDAIQDIDHAAHSEPEQWQPIETAPKDQTDILTFSKEGKIDVGYWENEFWCDGDYSYWEATHWMPLPKPPSELDKAKK